MNSDEKILDNTIGPRDTALPPTSGIARKKRSDAGIPRISPVTEIVRRFRQLSPEARATLLEALEALTEDAE